MMNNLNSFLLNSLLFENTSSTGYFPQEILIVALIIFYILSDQIIIFSMKNWIEIYETFYTFPDPFENNNGADENSESLDDFIGLDETVIQVVTDIKIKFEDVAGNEEAKKELKEVVRFLKNPSDFSKLGASVPKGVLLGGPPGTGKTLLAKAIAGESGTPFLKVSGSQFVELLVGVGASRVRELFEKAREMTPAIVFIDEIDSIARARAINNSMGGNDEREQTLNQLLTEMDGFQVDSGIVVIAATNRIDILDPAIKRPGRFDRQITINNPNLKERLAILKVHARGKKFKPGLSLQPVAFRTIGFSGADLANVLNEAAILATRKKKKWITRKEINSSIDRIVIGLEGKQLLRVKSRQLIAIHEMGHAFIAALVNGARRIEKITLVPRGESQGATWTTPSETQYNSREMFVGQILIGLGGRAAEESINGVSESTVGAQQDFLQITRLVRTMIVRYAMGRLQEFKQEAQQRNLSYIGSDIKIEINNIVDNFTTNFIDLSYNEVLRILQNIRPGGERLVDELLTFEELSGKELRGLIRCYLSNLEGDEFIYNARKAALLALIPPSFRKSIDQIEADIKKLIARVEIETRDQ